MYPLAIGGLGGPELMIMLAVLLLLFGATKLPELARGSGRALRIFKAETKGLLDDDEPDPLPAAQPGVQAPVAAPATGPTASPVAGPAAEPVAVDRLPRDVR